MKKSFANESECHIRRGYAGALSVFNGLSLWTGREETAFVYLFESTGLDF